MWTVNQLGTATNGTDTEIRVELNREHYHGDKTKFDIFKVTIADGIIRRKMLKDWLNHDDAVDFVNRLVDKLNERERIMKINGVNITHENFGDNPPRLDELAAYVKYAKARKPNVSSIIVTLCDDGAVDLNYVAREQKFEKIRRVTG